MRNYCIDVPADERKELEEVLRRQYVVRDVEDFITSFDPFEGDTLGTALHELVDHYHDDGEDGYGEADLVIWRDRRIVAVVRRGDAGQPCVTLF
jgi:hypothetical protein